MGASVPNQNYQKILEFTTISKKEHKYVHIKNSFNYFRY
jgi:hypothetical protein